MINKHYIKTKMPKFFNFIKSQPVLLKMAKKVDQYQRNRVYKSKVNQTKYYTAEETAYLLEQSRAQGLFDYTWYSQQQSRVFSCEREAFEDYLAKGAFSNINPSPVFDTELYYKTNTDIYLQGEQALAHYILNGKVEGRMALHATQNWRPKVIETTANGGVIDHKIAACFHVFYGEFIDYYLECLSDFPQVVDVFISVSSEELMEKAEKAFLGGLWSVPFLLK
ncbi:rhamnan synthesis F family protein [Marinomonas sp. GJ51-6]|uniref:rhamnan synthesis F family protein n=1 Tax=Marinomonas sp. GJ51-6 TaxID=2992802 RepID=UPI0029341700|nr:rhamnan synthesis F family protein [Marinomonas sp. GJ51-6]WOD06156.1 rhamnan synthesis F family protein [Marinomonas sp. GJ51-6]